VTEEGGMEVLDVGDVVVEGRILIGTYKYENLRVSRTSTPV
jgi:hypothetical protein